jgi:hypothetical protein
MSSTLVLSNVALLQVILGYIGAGEFVFFATVSKDWARSARGVDGGAEEDPEMEVASRRTFHRAAFVNAARLRLAHGQFGLSLCGTMCASAWDGDDQQLLLQRTAGRVCDLPTLQVAHELGLPLTDSVVCGVAQSASILKMQWLHTARQNRKLPSFSSCYAAEAGSIDMLRWLKEHGVRYDDRAMEYAAQVGHIAVLSYLRCEGCVWDEDTCSAAAQSGHLKALQLMRDHGCAWSAESICGDAAQSGSIECLRYLQQQGAPFNAETMWRAAGEGHLAMCQFLHAAGCEWNEVACHTAASSGHTSTLRFLRDNGCPWKPGQVCIAAASGGYIEMMQYLLHVHKLATAVRLTNMLNAAGAYKHLAAAQWLREQGAEWPPVLRCNLGWGTKVCYSTRMCCYALTAIV